MKHSFNLTLIFLTLILISCASLDKTKSKDSSTADSTNETLDEQQSQNQDFPFKQKKPIKKVALAIGGIGIASWATVGILKQLKRKKIKISCIVTTGWPSIFALSYGYLRSIHDVEWFSLRLKKTSFLPKQFISFGDRVYKQDNLKAVLQKTFKNKTNLGQSKTPIKISIPNPYSTDSKLISEGDWKTPIIKTMATPGIYQKLPNQENLIHFADIDFESASDCEADAVMSFSMYDDFLSDLGQKPESRALALAELRFLETKFSNVSNFKKIKLGQKSMRFESKKQAIRMGYQQTAKMLSEIDLNY